MRTLIVLVLGLGTAGGFAGCAAKAKKSRSGAGRPAPRYQGMSAAQKKEYERRYDFYITQCDFGGMSEAECRQMYSCGAAESRALCGKKMAGK